MTDALEVRSLIKSFGRRVVIDALDLKLPVGSMRCILGPNASGKSTLLNLIGGQLRPDSGTISVAGKGIEHSGTDQRRWLGVTRSFQIPQLMESLTIDEHLLLATKPRRSLLRWLFHAEKIVGLYRTDTAQRLHLPVAAMPARELSQTHKKLLDVAIAVVAKPTVLLLDEPTAGLDETSVDLMRELLVQLTQSTSILVVDHNLNFISKLNCPVSLLHAGRIVRTGTFDEIYNDDLTREFYLHVN
jgi:ABC-type branched-subunit amino acid transport system ATPase component